MKETRMVTIICFPGWDNGPGRTTKSKTSHDDVTKKKFKETIMETDVNVITMMLVFLGLGSSLIHYTKYAKTRAIAAVKKQINE
jgi:hypothetical protein